MQIFSKSLPWVLISLFFFNLNTIGAVTTIIAQSAGNILITDTIHPSGKNIHSGDDNKIVVLSHNHVALHVKDLRLSAEFYAKILGLIPIEVPDEKKTTRAWFKIGSNQQLHLLTGRTEPVVNDVNGSHFSLFIASIKQAEDFLTARKIPFHRQVRFDGVAQIYLPDPDGYLIELNER